MASALLRKKGLGNDRLICIGVSEYLTCRGEGCVMKRSLLWALVLLVCWTVPGCSATESRHTAAIVIAEDNSLLYGKAGQSQPIVRYTTGGTVSSVNSVVKPRLIDPEESLLVSQINGLRRAEGLPDLKMDSIISYNTRKGIRKLVQGFKEAYVESSWLEQIGGAAPDWDKKGFLLTGNSVEEVLKTLKGNQRFIRALAKPDLSHIAVGVFSKPGGGEWCSVWLVHRLVNLDPFHVTMSSRGLTDFTVSGTCGYRDLRVRFYKSEEEPDVYKGKDDSSVDIHTDQSGKFTATLPISKFGKGAYRIVIYVLDPSTNRFLPAAHTRFHVRS